MLAQLKDNRLQQKQAMMWKPQEKDLHLLMYLKFEDHGGVMHLVHLMTCSVAYPSSQCRPLTVDQELQPRQVDIQKMAEALVISHHRCFLLMVYLRPRHHH